VASAQTGDSLRLLTIQFRAQKIPMHEQALAEAQLRQAGGLFSLTDANQPEMEWRVRESTSNYVGSEPWGINHHVWHIEQVERIACERLIVDGLELEPYEYVEAVDDEGVVSLAARAFITDSHLEWLSAHGDVAEVTRVGISPEPRRMRFSYVWSERPDGMAVALACRDVGEPRVTVSGPWEGQDSMADLLDLLRAKGVLDDADVERLQKLRHAARRVANVDAWSL
jgi:hypothetical protein